MTIYEEDGEEAVDITHTLTREGDDGATRCQGSTEEMGGGGCCEAEACILPLGIPTFTRLWPLGPTFMRLWPLGLL